MCLAWERKGGKERAGLGCEEQRRQQQQSNEATKGPRKKHPKKEPFPYSIQSGLEILSDFQFYYLQNLDTSHTIESLSDQISFLCRKGTDPSSSAPAVEHSTSYGILLYGTLPAAAPKAPSAVVYSFFSSFFPFSSSRFPHTPGRLERKVVLYSYCTVLHYTALHRTTPYSTYRYFPLITTVRHRCFILLPPPPPPLPHRRPQPSHLIAAPPPPSIPNFQAPSLSRYHALNIKLSAISDTASS